MKTAPDKTGQSFHRNGGAGKGKPTRLTGLASILGEYFRPIVDVPIPAGLCHLMF